MGWFNFFSKKNGTELQNAGNDSITPNLNPDIPKELFSDGNLKLQQGSLAANGSGNGMEQVYNFLQADYESKGYSDALVNPDNSYKTDNIRLMQLDLKILIDKTNTYYENILSELSLHIVIRTRAGLVDLVQELETRKLLVEDHQKKLVELKQSMNDDNGMCQRIILSYQRGFMKGLSALTQSGILNRKI
jgi:hypothetical protein